MINDPYFSGKTKKKSWPVSYNPVCSSFKLELLSVNRRDDDDSAHGDGRHGEPSGHSGSGSEKRHGSSHRHKENVLWVLGTRVSDAHDSIQPEN